LLPAFARADHSTGSAASQGSLQAVATDPSRDTHSDSAVHAALASGAGKTVKFAAGTYSIGTSMSPSADTTVMCDGLCEFVPGAGFTGAAVHVRSPRVTVSGLTFARFKQAFDVNGVIGFTAQGNRVLSATGPG